MNAKEITITNIKGYGFNVGQSIPGKGTEIFQAKNRVASIYSYGKGGITDKDDIKEAIEKIQKVGIENCYISYCKTISGDSFEYINDDNFRKSLQKFDLKNIIDNHFYDFQAIAVTIRPELLGYVSLSKYKSSLESQQQLLIDLEFLRGVQIYDDMFSDDEYSIGERCFDLSDNNDYSAVWGDGRYAQDKDECTYFEGRGDYHNSILDDFWDLTINEEPSNYFKEIDPDESIALYHRKGKDWYIGYTLESEDIYITYKDEDGEIVEDEQFFVLKYRENEELLDRFVSWCESSKRDLEIRSYIYNELELEDCYDATCFDYNDNIFNIKLLSKIHEENLYEAAHCIADYVDYQDNTTSPKEAVKKAYEEYLMANLKDDKLFERYTHIKILKKMLKADDKELVYTQIGNFTEDKSYAISFKREEYHFTLGELINAKSIKEFYQNICKSLSKRLTERYEHTMLIQKAKNVFVGLEDSYKSGNCKSGTSEWCSRFGIDTRKIGAIRGDEILRLDFSNFTKRAVLQAIQNHTN